MALPAPVKNPSKTGFHQFRSSFFTLSRFIVDEVEGCCITPLQNPWPRLRSGVRLFRGLPLAGNYLCA